MTDPIIVPDLKERSEHQPPIAAIGASFDVHEWSGSGPDYLHIHYTDDEAWHVLEGTLTFRFRDKQVDAPAGTTIFVPAGVPHAGKSRRGARCFPRDLSQSLSFARAFPIRVELLHLDLPDRNQRRAGPPPKTPNS